MLTTLSIISLEQGRIWSEASAPQSRRRSLKRKGRQSAARSARSGFRPFWRSSGRLASEAPPSKAATSQRTSMRSIHPAGATVPLRLRAPRPRSGRPLPRKRPFRWA